MIYVLSIDIGIQHLGLSMTCLEDDYRFIEIMWVDMIDITVFRHKEVKMDDCCLHHTKTYADWINHVIQENKPLFEGSDVILIERQPPNGFNAIEQLLFNTYRDKSILIHPKKIHTFLGISSFDYDKRKELSIITSKKYLSDDLKNYVETLERSHDIADSICMMLYWKNKKNTEWKYKQHQEFCAIEFKDVFEKLESFRFKR
jgi:hypothetical protein